MSDAWRAVALATVDATNAAAAAELEDDANTGVCTFREAVSEARALCVLLGREHVHRRYVFLDVLPA